MNASSEPSAHPGWARAVIAVSTAIVVFRVCQTAAGFVFLWTRGFKLLLPVVYFLHNWDDILVPGVSLVAAVLVSRWMDQRFLGRSRRVVMVAGIALTVVALFPIEVRLSEKPVMVSPLQTAIVDHYSLETVEAIIDRYPRLVNGSDRTWDHYTPLVNVALEGRTNLVELLIRKGASVKRRLESIKWRRTIEKPHPAGAVDVPMLSRFMILQQWRRAPDQRR